MFAKLISIAIFIALVQVVVTDAPTAMTQTYKYECTQSNRVYEYTRKGSYKCPEHGGHCLRELR